MGEVSEALLIRIAADTEQMKAGLAKAKTEISGFNKTVKGLGATMGAAFGGRQVFNFFKSTVDAAADAEAATSKLSAALKAQGDTSAETREDVLALSSALQAQTTFDDEAITGVQTLLIQLGRLRGEGLEKATRATLDLAAGLGIDLNAAALLVGKAAAGNVTAFSRYGLTVKSTGDRAKDFANVLAQIQGKFGGSASAEVQTYAGSVKQLGNAFGDFKELVGGPVKQEMQTLTSFWGKQLSLLNRQLAGMDTVISENKNLREEENKVIDVILRRSKGIVGLEKDQEYLAQSLTGLTKKDIEQQKFSDELIVSLKARQLQNIRQLEVEKKLADAATAKAEADAAAATAEDAAAARAKAHAESLAELQAAFSKIHEEERKVYEQRERAAAQKEGKRAIEMEFETKGDTDENPYTRQLAAARKALAALQAQVEAAEDGQGPIPEDWIAQAEELKTKIEQLKAAEKELDAQRQAQAEADRERAAMTEQALSSIGGAMLNVAMSGGTMEQRINAALVSIGETAAQMALQFAINKAMERLYTTNTARTSVAASASSAAAGAASSQAGIPIVGPGLAAAAAAQTYAMTMAYQATIPGFAKGGIVGGALGQNDPNVIRANRGEEVLTAKDPRHRNNLGGGTNLTVNLNDSTLIRSRSTAETALMIRRELKAALQDLHATGELNWGTA